MDTELFATWRAELEAELREAEELVEDRKTARAAAEAEHAKLLARRAELAGAISKLQDGASSQLLRRLLPLDREIHSAEGRITHADQGMKNGLFEIEGLQKALTQCEALIAGPPAPVDPPKEQLVWFDDTPPDWGDLT